jgi:hypothetical protein
MLKEYDINLREGSSIIRLTDAELLGEVITGPGSVTLAEILYICLISAEQIIPRNVISAAAVGKGETQAWALRKCGVDWNEMLPDKQMVDALKSTFIANAGGAISLVDSSDSEKVRHQQLKIENMRTMLQVISRELYGK